MVNLQRSTACSFFHLFLTFLPSCCILYTSKCLLITNAQKQLWCWVLSPTHNPQQLSLMRLRELICNKSPRQNFYLIKKRAAQLSDCCLIIHSSWGFFHKWKQLWFLHLIYSLFPSAEILHNSAVHGAKPCSRGIAERASGVPSWYSQCWFLPMSILLKSHQETTTVS